MAKGKAQAKSNRRTGAAGRARVSQTEVPAHSLSEALRVPRSIIDHYGGKATRPIDVAQAMELQPTTGKFRMLCGASIAYGLTEGGCNASQIEPTQLARRIVSPTEEGDDLAAMREAVLRPRIIREFLEKYDGAKYPREDIAMNVLVNLGAPKERSAEILTLVADSASNVGFFKEIGGIRYVDLQGAAEQLHSPEQAATETTDPLPPTDSADEGNGVPHAPAKRVESSSKSENRKVFVTHGKNKALVPQLKELLTYGKFEPIVSVERETVSKPVPDKVLDDMRICGAAIIHVDADRELITPEGEREHVLNGNVLIEIGAAMALYRRRFILLVKQGVKLPSNLQGLYEVRYEGDKLDGDATIRLLKAFNEFNTPGG